MTHSQKAGELFANGSNCAQAIFAAFSDVTGMDEDMSLRISSSFGGGMGKMREVCGALSGAFMVIGILYGYTQHDDTKKSEVYATVRDFSERFKKQNGSILCRELLEGVETSSSSEPEKRTTEYYKKRPCREYVEIAAEILDEMIAEKGLPG